LGKFHSVFTSFSFVYLKGLVYIPAVYYNMLMEAKKPLVIKDLCIACGLCNSLVPSVFDWDDDGKMKTIVETVPEGTEAEVEEARVNCPTAAIEVK
jgi:ferredoxin